MLLYLIYFAQIAFYIVTPYKIIAFLAILFISLLEVSVLFQVKPWVKTSLAPGSGVVTKYLLKRYHYVLEWSNFSDIFFECNTESICTLL